MLEKSDTDISDTLKRFNRVNLEVAMLVPTETGMRKSIMDATSPLRDFLAESGFHDFSCQEQGPAFKVSRRAFFVDSNGLQETTVSLYRPLTKQGDPRIWFGKLARYACAYNLLALVVFDQELYVINCSNQDRLTSILSETGPLKEIIAISRPRENPDLIELLGRLVWIHKKGFIPTMRVGDTGVGMTLETLLGIQANSSKAPDFRGIEIKAKRVRGNRPPNRVTLFSQVPNWSLSPIGSAWCLLNEFGYRRQPDDKLRLNHEMNAVKPNSKGFILELDLSRDWLLQNYVEKDTKVSRHLITWEMALLRQRLVEKHPQTLWVEASCEGKREQETFHYMRAVYTTGPKGHTDLIRPSQEWV